MAPFEVIRPLPSTQADIRSSLSGQLAAMQRVLEEPAPVAPPVVETPAIFIAARKRRSDAIARVVPARGV